MIKRQHFYFIYLVIFAIFISTQNSMAQEDCGGVGQPPCQDEIPLDGGISLLLAAGAAYGAKKIRDYHQDKDRTE